VRDLRSHVVRGILVLAIVSAGVARAEPAAKPPGADAEAQARQCFQRGLDLFDENDLDGAVVEFRRAYELAANYRILYNLGQVAAERHDYARAMDFFTRYLADGAEAIPADRRRAVEDELAKLRQRVGRIEVVATAPASERYEILIDDEPVGWVPLEGPITVNLGRRRVALRGKDGPVEARQVEVPSGELVRVELKAPHTGRARRAYSSASSPTSTGALMTTTPSGAGTATTGTGVWVAWVATGLCGAGALTSGLLANRWDRDLRDQRASYPVTRDQLASQQSKVRTAGWVTDGLIVGTAVLAAVSLTLTFRGSHEQSVSLSAQGLSLQGHF
jgi:hypothetical protein